MAHALSLRPTVNKPNKSHLGHAGIDDVAHALWAVVRQRRLRKVRDGMREEIWRHIANLSGRAG